MSKTGASREEILNMPYIIFIIGSADAPSIDYDSEESGENKVNTPVSAEEEAAAFSNYLG